ncbi:MAG: hypothetical protein EXR64_05345 [Dehalococcoidia bacterium]|nr:hypothetical protein [Dehalococcoidia bacterium]
MTLPARLDGLFPAIPSQPLGVGRCWIALAKAQGEEHHPPFYWLGRALDAVDAAGADSADVEAFAARFSERLVAAHGREACNGEDDERVQDVLSEACAFAWAAAHLGPPRFEPAVEGATLVEGRLRVHVAAHDAYVLPVRLRPPLDAPAMIRGRVLRPPNIAVAQAATAHVEEAGTLLPPARGRIIYVDTWIEELYAQNVGYRLELTEPVTEALRQAASARHLGHVLTRPFQWGNPVSVWY